VGNLEALAFYCQHAQELDELKDAIDEDNKQYIKELLGGVDEKQQETVCSQTNELYILVEGELHSLWLAFSEGLRGLPIGEEVRVVKKENAPWFMDWWVHDRLIQVAAIVDKSEEAGLGLRCCIWMVGGNRIASKVAEKLSTKIGIVVETRVKNFMGGCAVFPRVPLVQSNRVDEATVVSSLLAPYEKIDGDMWNVIKKIVIDTQSR
jgi:hypothetical protein